MEEKKDKASIGMKILSFLIPLVGLILFITKKKEQPGYAKGCGIAALIGVIVGVIVIPITIAAVIGIMGVLVVNTANEAIKSTDLTSSISAYETAAYNAKYEAYEGSNSVAQVKSLLAIVRTNNAIQDSADRKVEVTLDGTTVDPSVASNQLKNGEKYSVKMHYNDNGLVDKIVITNAVTSSSTNTMTNSITNTATNSVDSTNTVTNTTNSISSTNTVLDTNTIHNTIDSIANTINNTISYTNGLLNQLGY